MLSYAPPTVGESVVLDTFERTASNDVQVAVQSLRRAYEDVRNRSQIRNLLDQYDALNWSLNQLTLVDDDWNGYGSPRPSEDSIEKTRMILSSLCKQSLLPDKILPSADGGVSLVFRTATENRAVIERLNEEGTYVLLYDRMGNSKTIAWNENFLVKRDILGQLSRHLQGTRLAAD